MAEEDALGFDDAQLARLRADLRLKSEGEAIHVAAMIAGRVWQCRWESAARERTPDIEAAQKRLDRIATTAALLARLLDEEPNAEELIRLPGWSLNHPKEYVGENGAFHSGKMHDDDRGRLKDFIQTARTIRRMAEDIICDDTRHRAHLELPRKSHAGATPHVVNVWPLLFDIWAAAGMKVATSNRGPTHRFVQFIHDVFGLPPAAHTTLREAVARWHRRGPSPVFADGPPWRAVPEED